MVMGNFESKNKRMEIFQIIHSIRGLFWKEFRKTSPVKLR
jgi:hypothetical protein